VFQPPRHIVEMGQKEQNDRDKNKNNSKTKKNSMDTNFDEFDNEKIK